jgi:hypothetical protein
MHACSLFKEKEILLQSFTTEVKREPVKIFLHWTNILSVKFIYRVFFRPLDKDFYYIYI